MIVMRAFYYFSLLLSLCLLGACSALPAPEEPSAVLPTRLVLPSATAAQQPFIPAVDRTPTPVLSMPIFAWFLNPDDRTVLGVNPQNQQVVIKIPTTFIPGLVAATQEGAWVTQSVDENTTSLLHLDPQSSQVTDDIPVQHGNATSISVAGEYVWLTMRLPTGTPDDKKGGVVQIDIKQRKILRFIETGAFPLQVAATPQSAWVLVKDALTTHFITINPTSGEITPLPAVVQSSTDLQLFARFTVNASGLWATPQQVHSLFIFNIDPQTGKVLNTIKMGESYDFHPIDITANDHSIFVALKNNSIVTLPAGKITDIQPVKINAPIDWITVSGGTVWAWSHSAASAYQMDSAGNHMSAGVPLGSTPVPTPTVVSYPTPSMMGAFKPCDGVDFESNLRPGMKAIVNPDPPLPDRVRISASSSGKVVDVVNANHWVEILEGPACVEGKVWWKVHTQNNVIGWTMEGDGIDHWLVPDTEN